MQSPGESQEIGSRIRSIREARGLSARRLAQASGLSVSFISQFERGLSDASIGTLRRIAQALGVNTADLFDANSLSSHSLVRAADRPVVSASGGTTKELVSTPSTPHVEVYKGHLEVGGTSAEEPYTHGNSLEIVYVLSGTILYSLNGQTYELGVGDSIEHSTAEPHAMRNAGAVAADVMWIIAPPSTSNRPSERTGAPASSSELIITRKDQE